MIAFPEIDPVIISFGPLQVRWYGLMYVLGFCASYYLVRHQIQKFHFQKLEKHFENLNVVLLLSVIVGGRLGYVLFYNFGYYIEHPLQIFATWEGGMSFHGACLTLILSGAWFTKKHAINFWASADLYCATIPLGLGFGRIGNFINGELFGKVTTVPWAMVFPQGGSLPRHPSQLYEAICEGLLLFVLLWFSKNKPWQQKRNWPHGSILALFLIGYGLIRTVIEFFRQPDPQLGYLMGFFTMGQLLSTIMITGGSLLWVFLAKRSAK